MSAVYLSTAYLAPVSYYARLVHCDEIRLEVWENFPKQTCRNRCLIATAGGRLALTVPVEKPATPKCLTRDIRISDHGNWRHAHWNALVSAYNMSPFFEYYADDFRPFYAGRRYDYLLDYNEALRSMICGLLDLHPVITHTEQYVPEVPNDFRPAFSPRASDALHPSSTDAPAASSPGAPRPYYQVFRDKHGFIPDLSIVDLLFNTGPESILFL
jgi:hypothetical protein